MVSHAVWKTWPSGLSNDKNLGLRPRFLSTESPGPCFSHGMGDHDQILHYSTLGLILPWRVIQIKICAEYRDMLPRPRLVCQEPGLRLIGRSPGVPDKSSRGLGSMSRYSAQILICFIAYIFLIFSFLCGFSWELCRTASMHSALCHCPL